VAAAIPEKPAPITIISAALISIDLW